MRLERLGAAHPTRLSFLRAMLRRASREQWRFSIPLWDLDAAGHGRALLAIDTPERRYTQVCFSTPLADADRTDRVIATAWDTSYVLYDGEPDSAEIARLEANVRARRRGGSRQTTSSCHGRTRASGCSSMSSSGWRRAASRTRNSSKASAI